MHIRSLLSERIEAAFAHLGLEGQALLQAASRPEFGDYQANGVMAAAKRAGIGAAIHLEPYEGRGAESVALDLAHLVTHDLYRLPRRPCGGHTRLPVVYLYDAYHTPAEEWARLFCDDGDLSVRGTPHDVVVIATLLNRDEEELVVNGCFDGFYSYFATDGFTYGSTSAHWKLLAAWARKKNLWFSPSAGPGYNDTRIRPWNDIATRDRKKGAYYRKMLGAAVESGADLVSITSWNEWGEGTQIEAAAPHLVHWYDPFRRPGPDIHQWLSSLALSCSSGFRAVRLRDDCKLWLGPMSEVSIS